MTTRRTFLERLGLALGIGVAAKAAAAQPPMDAWDAWYLHGRGTWRDAEPKLARMFTSSGYLRRTR